MDIKDWQNYDKEKQGTWRKLPVVLHSLPGLGLNPCLHSERIVTKHLSHGTFHDAV
jgi:hypothetical protein